MSRKHFSELMDDALDPDLPEAEQIEARLWDAYKQDLDIVEFHQVLFKAAARSLLRAHQLERALLAVHTVFIRLGILWMFEDKGQPPPPNVQVLGNMELLNKALFPPYDESINNQWPN